MSSCALSGEKKQGQDAYVAMGHDAILPAETQRKSGGTDYRNYAPAQGNRFSSIRLPRLERSCHERGLFAGLSPTGAAPSRSNTL
jgi:hypothetical protein